MKKMAAVLLQVALLTALFVAGLKIGPPVHALYARWFPEPTSTLGDYRHFYLNAKSKVVIFGTSSCPYCRAARQFFAARQIEFDDAVIDQSAAARTLFDKLDSPAVPVIIIGDRKIIGWRTDVVESILRAQGIVNGKVNVALAQSP
jgi:glutaredoxin